MRLWHRFRALPPAEKRLIWEAAVVVVVMRCSLLVFPAGPVLRQVQGSLPARRGSRRHPAPAERVAWAVEAVSHRLLGPDSCLVRALAGRLLLARHGHSATLRIGVARSVTRALAAHAWIECEGKVVLGGRWAQRFTSLQPVSVQ